MLQVKGSVHVAEQLAHARSLSCSRSHLMLAAGPLTPQTACCVSHVYVTPSGIDRHADCTCQGVRHTLVLIRGSTRMLACDSRAGFQHQ